jgi:hypothetical protein
MEKHIQLVGILNIVYRSVLLLVSLLLLFIAAEFRQLFEMILSFGQVDIREIPPGIPEIIPLILCIVGLCMFVISVTGIIAGAGVLGRRPWGRILMLVISFFHLIRVPVGTILGGYSIWVLLNDETIKLFNAPRVSA